MNKSLNKNTKRKSWSVRDSIITCIALVMFANTASTFAEETISYKGMFVAETVKPGTTFSSLAEKYYGNKDFWVYIYLANKSDIPTPTDLKEGMSVIIPEAQALNIDAKDPASVAKARELAKKTEQSNLKSKEVRNQGNPPASDGAAFETVKQGDTFRTLALKYYGDKEFWVYIFLANKGKNPHPNKLNYGTKVVIPSAASLGIDAKNPASLAKAKELGRKAISESN